MNNRLDYLPEKKAAQRKAPMGVGKLLLLLIAVFVGAFCLYWFDLPRGRSDGRIYLPLIVLPFAISMVSIASIKDFLQKHKPPNDEKPKAHEETRG